MILERYRLKIDELPIWAFKVLGGCAVCFSGQLALWAYFFKDGWSFGGHFVYVVLTIFFTDVIIKTYYQ